MHFDTTVEACQGRWENEETYASIHTPKRITSPWHGMYDLSCSEPANRHWYVWTTKYVNVVIKFTDLSGNTLLTADKFAGNTANRLNRD